MAGPDPLNPKVPQLTFLGFLWGGTACSFFFVIFRLFVRLKAFHRVWWDDVLVVFAWFCFLGTAIIWNRGLFGLYSQFGLANGTLLPTPAILSAFLNEQHNQIAILVLFYSCLWSIKLSFLIFFRRLSAKVRGQRIWWWCVTGLVVATYLTCIGTIQYPCLAGDFEYIETQCITAASIRFENYTFHYLLAVDLITDCSIISIPILMLWNVRIPLKQKLGLIGIFSLTVIVMVFAIIRVVVVNKFSKQADITWLYFWTNLEMSVALIVSCLASFRQLFVKTEQHGHSQHSDSFFSSMRKGLLVKIRTFQSSPSGSYFNRTSRKQNDHSFDSKTHIVPLKKYPSSHDVPV